MILRKLIWGWICQDKRDDKTVRDNWNCHRDGHKKWVSGEIAKSRETVKVWLALEMAIYEPREIKHLLIKSCLYHMRETGEWERHRNERNMGMRETWKWQSHGNETHMGHLERWYSSNSTSSSFPCPFHSHVSLIPMSLTFPYLSYYSPSKEGFVDKRY